MKGSIFTAKLSLHQYSSCSSFKPIELFSSVAPLIITAEINYLKLKVKVIRPIVNSKVHASYLVKHEFPPTHLDMPVHTVACLSALELVCSVGVS
jgi:hypothetical protein